MHYVTIEIKDVNNPLPSFSEREQEIEIAEYTLPGRDFQLHAAHDPNAGINSIRTYVLTEHDQSAEDKIQFLVLKRP